jgi:tocopherol cyclase
LEVIFSRVSGFPNRLFHRSSLVRLFHEDRVLQTPHSGYHWNGVDPGFFEGWYFRVTLPKIRESFAFMYSIEDPLGKNSYSGGAAQLLGIGEEYLSASFPDTRKFWAAKDYLGLGNWGETDLDISPQQLPIAEFDRSVKRGYQVTTSLHQGALPELDCRWCYHTVPVYGWGHPYQPQQATAGLLSFLPIFEPGWQILMAHGLATGWIEWRGKRYHFNNTPAYSEKNWGRSFPEKWFWLNCNSFEDIIGLAITAGGGRRKVLWNTEEVAAIGIHYRDRFYEFVPWNSRIYWQIQPWGEWRMQATNPDFKIELTGMTDSAGTMVSTPTESGLVMCCRDTLKGRLSIELSTRRGDRIIKASSINAGLEVGGDGWDRAWIHSVNSEQ